MTENETIDRLRAVIARLHDKIDDLEAELAEYRNENEQDKASVKRRISEIEGGEAGKSDSEGGVNGSETMLPIERLSKFGENHVAIANVTASVNRATSIFEHFDQWAEKAPAGRVIKSNLKTLLETATGEALAWRQVYRACRKLEEWSKGTIEFVRHDRHGWMLIQEQPSSLGERIRPSSANGG